MAITISGDSPNLTSPNITGAVLSSMASSVITSGTAVASTSGTSIDFTSIPSWVKRITVMFNGVSTNGSSLIRIQLGDSGGIETTGYTSGTTQLAASGVASTSGTGGYDIYSNAASNVFSGSFTINLLNANIWVGFGIVNVNGTVSSLTVAGSKTLSDTLDRVRITTVNGTDTFDAGTINILYE